MINLFNRIYNWLMRFVIAYHDFKLRNYQRKKCNYCKKTYTFDVPKDIPIEQIVFICNNCEPKHRELYFNESVDNDGVEKPYLDGSCKLEFKEADDDNVSKFYQRLVSSDGNIEMGIYPTIFGYRVRAGYVGNGIYELDWCGGDDQKQVELLYSIMKNILEHKGGFSGVPSASVIKPFYNDEDFVNKINEMITKPLDIKLLKPLILDRKKLMDSY